MEKIINLYSILNTPPIRYIHFNLLTMFNWKKKYLLESYIILLTTWKYKKKILPFTMND